MGTNSGEVTQLSVDLCKTMLESGMSVADIAEELDTTTSTIYRWAETYYPDLLQTIKEQKYQQLLDDYQAIDLETGAPLYLVTVICAKYQVSTTNLYQILATNDIPSRRSAAHPRKQIRQRAVVELYQESVPLSAICTTLKMSPNTVYSILAAQDPPIPLRNRQWERDSGALREIQPGVFALVRPTTTAPPPTQSSTQEEKEPT